MAIGLVRAALARVLPEGRPYFPRRATLTLLMPLLAFTAEVGWIIRC
jgi:hypothetical protein